MRLRLLGAAAGGGFPQWNCACACCELARVDPVRARPRTQCSLAVSGGGKEWHLIDADPDIRVQVESFSQLHPGPGARDTPIRGVLLTDAELDHTIGLLGLREGSPLEIFGTEAVLAALDRAFPVMRVTASYSVIRWTVLVPGRSFALERGRLEVIPFWLSGKQPRYTAGAEIEGDWVVGYRIVDVETGGVVVFAPCIERWSSGLEAALAGAQCAFVDGTFFSDDEMGQVGTGQLRATAMGHLPMIGEHGTASRLAALQGCRVVYVHINNTNPVLDELSAESARLHAMGLEVGWDGLEVDL